MTVLDAQDDLRRAYVGGGPGVFASALMWFVAGLVERSQSVGPAFAVLFFSGMLIFPLSALACRLLFRREKEAPDNPLGRTALESTFAMIGGLFAAWLFLRYQPSWVFPLAAVAVGTHYAAFRTVYGDNLFWLLGALITTIGLVSIYEVVPVPAGPIFAVAAIELMFAILLTMRETRTARSR